MKQQQIVTFTSASIDIIAYPLDKTIKYSTIVNGNNACCLLFHCCSWFVLSILRYVYIVHKAWIENKFPDPDVLGRLSILSVFSTFLACFGYILLTASLCGWPKNKIFEMPRVQKIITFRFKFYVLILLSNMLTFWFLNIILISNILIDQVLSQSNIWSS